MTSRPPLREITPEERRRSARTFWWIIVAFVAGIMATVAALAWQGRAEREYGAQVLRAVQATHPDAHLSYSQGCSEALPGTPLPKGVLACTVKVDAGEPTVTLQIEGGRQYRVGP